MYFIGKSNRLIRSFVKLPDSIDYYQPETILKIQANHRMQFEFLIPKRPVSGQTTTRKILQKWKTYVQEIAEKSWSGTPLSSKNI